jgi:cyclopropane fatty-acyl-phospholipid synthase-like methyltransferase
MRRDAIGGESTDAAAAYEANARAFIRGRDRSPIGARVVEQWARRLSKGATVIELACGGGYPVTTVLDAAGLQIWAIDASPTLVGEFKTRFPKVPVRCERVQESNFFGRKFEAAIAIGLLFLLPEADQAALIAGVSRILVPGGRFLVMAPLPPGTWADMNTGLECISLGQERYVELLTQSGFRVVGTHLDEGANNYYEAETLG